MKTKSRQNCRLRNPLTISKVNLKSNKKLKTHKVVYKCESPRSDHLRGWTEDLLKSSLDL